MYVTFDEDDKDPAEMHMEALLRALDMDSLAPILKSHEVKFIFQILELLSSFLAIQTNFFDPFFRLMWKPFLIYVRRTWKNLA